MTPIGSWLLLSSLILFIWIVWVPAAYIWGWKRGHDHCIDQIQNYLGTIKREGWKPMPAFCHCVNGHVFASNVSDLAEDGTVALEDGVCPECGSTDFEIDEIVTPEPD